MKPLIIFLGAILFSLYATAVPARRTAKIVTLADGSTTTITLTGDERCHFFLTEDSRVLMADENDRLYFATESPDGRLMRSDVIASGSAPVDASLSRLSSSIRRSIEAKYATHAATSAARFAASSAINSSKGVGLYATPYIKGMGSPRCLVLLVEYKDVAFTTADAGTYFSNMINQPGFSENGATGSVTDYFKEASTGQFTPRFDVYGPVKLPQTRSYYGGNDRYGEDKAADDMVRHAAEILADDIDFSAYDNDGDGVVDNVYVIYAGKGEASGGGNSTVWPHSFDLSETSGGRYEVDGLYLDHYACSNEIEGSKADGIGTFVHEFSHVLGLPDLYTTNYGAAETLTPGAYSVLDYGPYNNNGNTPPTYSAFERNAMGWIDCEVLDRPTDIKLPHILTSNKAYIIPTSANTEFFLLENRQQAGSDRYIPGHGMLIWHIDYKSFVWTMNTINNTASHQYVDIEEACGTADNLDEDLMAGYPFPGTRAKTEFTSATTPALKTWEGEAIDMPVTDITESDEIISALASGGTSGGIDDIPFSDDSTAVRYVNLQGIPVATPRPGMTVIAIQGSKIKKITF